MNVLHGRFLLIVPALAVLLAAPAVAQNAANSGIYAQPLPPPTFGTRNSLDDDIPRPTGSIPQVGRDGQVSRDGHYFPTGREADALPPPGLPIQDGQSYGHQLDSRPLPPIGGQADGPLPPAGIGAAPSPAPVASQAPAADAVPGTSVMTLPPEDQPETGTPKELPANLKRQLVDFQTKEPAGTIIIDTPNTYLYLVLGHGKALRYGIGVGREGFTWSGTERISRMKEWPDWFPPPEMIERQPYLPRMMAGGPGNPLGARALYLGHTLYRIHGTNQPSTIGQTVSSGCIRLLNEDIEDLYSRVQVGTRVVVLPGKAPAENVASTGAATAAVAAHGVSTGALPPIR
jgi:lipoprotein-anchoring transpeptidase ErfK/SrfK